MGHGASGMGMEFGECGPKITTHPTSPHSPHSPHITNAQCPIPHAPCPFLKSA
ncbi:MAG: hypothetical protein F6J93_21710 [Oscillatoria sp. SIO1A7]|nr:hypothetical protein [Oscillatoria sp. SIO1A7]